MKLAAIINVWRDCVELLPACISESLMWADECIVIWSRDSNSGEAGNWSVDYDDHNLISVEWKPVQTSAQTNELFKRNFGVHQAKKRQCTHFIMMDADEFYIRGEMETEKERIYRDNLNGLVHPLKVYVGKPTLWCEDHTLVPGIQKLYPDTQLGNFKNYPFAYDAQGHAHIDPTRRTNQTTGIEMSPFYMHHMSYVRRDINLKIRNSSANLRRSEAAIKRDIANAAPGYMSELYHRELKECENLFNITI